MHRMLFMPHQKINISCRKRFFFRRHYNYIREYWFYVLYILIRYDRSYESKLVRTCRFLLAPRALMWSFFSPTSTLYCCKSTEKHSRPSLALFLSLLLTCNRVLWRVATRRREEEKKRSMQKIEKKNDAKRNRRVFSLRKNKKKKLRSLRSA